MEKPDFEKIGSDLYDKWVLVYEGRNVMSKDLFTLAVQSLWSSHVEPLQKENENLLYEVGEGKRSLKAQEELFCGLTSNKIAFKLWNEKQSEIDNLKIDNHLLENEKDGLIQENRGLREERDSFAKDFALYIWRQEYTRLWTREGLWHNSIHHLKSTEELLELYKESIKEKT